VLPLISWGLKNLIPLSDGVSQREETNANSLCSRVDTYRYNVYGNYLWFQKLTQANWEGGWMGDHIVLRKSAKEFLVKSYRKVGLSQE